MLAKNKINLAYALLLLIVSLFFIAIIEPGDDYYVYYNNIQNNYIYSALSRISEANLFGKLYLIPSTLFTFILATINYITNSISLTLIIVGATNYFTAAYFVVCKVKRKYFCTLLISPIFIDLSYFQLRNGFALSLFIIGFFLLNSKKNISYFLMIFASLLHNFLLVLLLAYIISKFLYSIKNFINNEFFLKIISVYLAAIITVAVYLFFLLGFDDYKIYISYNLYNFNNWMAIIFFTNIVLFLISINRIFILDDIFTLIMATFLLGTYFYNNQAIRVFAAVMPFIVARISYSINYQLGYFFVLIFNLYAFKYRVL